MTDRKQALTELLAKVDAGDDTSFENLIREIHPNDVGFRFSKLASRYVSAYYGSLDAAKALHEAVLGDDWHWSIFSGESCVYKMDHPHSGNSFRAKTGNYSRAWLVCILSALIAQEDAQ